MIGFIFEHWEYFAVLIAAAAFVFAIHTWVPTKKLRTFGYAAVAIFAVTAIGNLGFADFKKHYIAVGDAQCEDRHTVAKAKAKEKTIAKQTELRTKSQEVEDAVRKQKGADAPASDYLRGVFDIMRRRN